MKMVCEDGICAGCKLCEDICLMNAISIEEGIAKHTACIDEEKCTGCGRCQAHCPQIHVPALKKPTEWYQGWSKHDEIRSTSASGGLAAEIMGGFLRSDGSVCTCVFKSGEFRFEFLEDASQISFATGSKYVKSNPSGIYKELERRLKLGEKVLLIGLPCQVAAARNYLGYSLSEKFYAIDLVCHGTPSPETLRLFVKGKKKDLGELRQIAFRKKTFYSMYLDGVEAEPNYMDEYTYTFNQGIIFMEDCYHCRYAQIERVGDLTLADSWGSDFPEEEQKKGISLILCQSEKGRELLSMADADLKDVDLDNAVQYNSQLRGPMPKPASRDLFINGIASGKSFGSMMWKIEPKMALKNLVKKTIGWNRRSERG